MRALFAALLCLGACATSPALPADRLAGCWINRGETSTRTMRWLPDAERPGVLKGDMLIYPSGGGDPQSSHFTLEPRDSGWVFCSYETGQPRCRDVAHGDRGSLEGGRVFIDRYGESLRIAVIGAGPEQIIFRGQRDGCD